MPDAVVLSGCRTAIGTAYKGTLSETSAFDLAAAVVPEALRRSGLDASDIDDMVLGETLYGGGDIARYIAQCSRAPMRPVGRKIRISTRSR